ncbi:hypothetical protein QN277_016496 [Acacia crassicarpa]|uniref:Uncharacterized protein n=1 Tax=Acacia crassicarpa TaxID=499986 RepID=A0AAE1MWX2_9FABA|nr:hypothetical protein QN277_016496 [Acacia crassicarpa]
MEKKSMLRHVLDLLNHSIFVRTVGSLSCVVGLLCYALSSSFKFLFGEWNPTKIVLYIILSSIISVGVLFEAKSRVSFVSKLKPHVQFLVLMLTSLYSFFADRSAKGKPDTWSVVSSGAFALTSLCLSRQIKPGFDVGLFSFFLGCVTVQLMKARLIFILVAAGFCYPLVILRSYSEWQSENGDSSAEESVEIRIDDANRASSVMGQDKSGQISPRRRVRNVSPSPSPPPSTLFTEDDDDANRASFVIGYDKAGQTNPRRRGRIARNRRSGKGGFSSNDPLLARPPAHGNKSFEILPKVAATEQFPSDLLKQETRQQLQLQEQQLERLQIERLWLQEQLLQQDRRMERLQQEQLESLQLPLDKPPPQEQQMRRLQEQQLQPHHLLQLKSLPLLLQLKSLPLLLEQPPRQEKQQPRQEKQQPLQEQQLPLPLRRRQLRRRRPQPAAEAEAATAAADICV